MYQSDWFMRQIEMLVQFITRALFGKPQAEYILMDEACPTWADELYLALKALLAQEKICEAENLLIASFQQTEAYLRVAVDFYSRLNTYTDVQLEQANFSRDEIDEGLRDVLRRYGVKLP